MWQTCQPNLTLIVVAKFTWRVPHKVPKSLTVQYDKILYPIEGSKYAYKAIAKYIDIWH